jgi:hypothetical protein
MNRQPNDRELNSNTNPSSVDVAKVEEPNNLKVDTLISSFYATAAHASSQSIDYSHHTSFQGSSSNLQDSRSSIEQNEDRAQQRIQMTEHYLLKALNLDRP